MALVGTSTRVGIDRKRLGALGAAQDAELPEFVVALSPYQRLFRYVAAALFSWGFVSIPWYTWRPRAFKDVTAYLAQLEALRANSEELDLERLFSLEYIFSEPLWRQILAALDVSNDPRDALVLVTFIVVLIFSTYLFVRVSPWFAMFVMFNPSVVDLVVAQTRSALAAALCLVAASLKSRQLALWIVCASALIHTLTFVFVTVYLLANVLSRYRTRFDYVTLGCIAMGLGALFAASFSVGRSGVLAAVGDRRAYIEGTGNTISYTVYWVLLAGALALTNRLSNEIVWKDFYAIVMLVMPLVTTGFSVATARLIPLTWPLIIESISARPHTIRLYLSMSLIAYQLLHYQYWLR